VHDVNSRSILFFDDREAGSQSELADRVMFGAMGQLMSCRKHALVLRTYHGQTGHSDLAESDSLDACSQQHMYGQVPAITRYVPFGSANHHSHAPLGILGNKMMNDTKSRQLQDARDSGASSGTRTEGEQV